MCGGVIYYSPDITAASPSWTEVFDDSTATYAINQLSTEGGGCDGGGWVQTSHDDRFLYHAVIGRNPVTSTRATPAVPKMVYVLDIQALLAAGPSPQCSIDTLDEVIDGGAEPDCPALVSIMPLPDGTSGGPHWGAIDNFKSNGDGTFSELGRATTRAASRVSNYFVARSGVDGNHKVCMLNVSPDGLLSLDTTFRDEHEGTPCIDFNRTAVAPTATRERRSRTSELFVVKADRLR